jgi:hypothetical protein
VRLASARCSVIFNSTLLYKSGLWMNYFLQLQQLTTLKFFSFNKLPSPTQVEETFTPILQLFEHLQILDLSSTIYGASCMLYLGSTCKPKIRYQGSTLI